MAHVGQNDDAGVRAQFAEPLGQCHGREEIVSAQTLTCPVPVGPCNNQDCCIADSQCMKAQLAHTVPDITVSVAGFDFAESSLLLVPEVGSVSMSKGRIAENSMPRRSPTATTNISHLDDRDDLFDIAPITIDCNYKRSRGVRSAHSPPTSGLLDAPRRGPHRPGCGPSGGLAEFGAALLDRDCRGELG